MNLNSPRKIALFLAFLLSLVGVLISVTVIYLFNGSQKWIFVISGLILFVSFFLIIYSVFKRFIHKRINILYRTIHNLKLSSASNIDLEMSEDVFSKVDSDVKDWAAEKIDEIRTLKEQDNFRKEFIGNLAHELKTPLFNIQGYVLSLHEGASEDPVISKKFIKKAAKNVERMTRIIEDLDDISHFGSNRLELEIEVLDILKLIKDQFNDLEESAQKKDVTLSFEKEYEGPLLVKADEFRIGQVMTNLLSNSISYGKKGGDTVVRFHDMAERILVEVADDGPGIEEKHLPRLFERFYRVDASRSRNEGGTGLGLAIVKHIIEAHGQSINARSTVGVGSTFSFTLAKA
ncbi:MAG: sensor histidine kinase [Flavobacteriales bacterium]|nr:sensor histidine kinase [Flavobacteriales bacterium]